MLPKPSLKKLSESLGTVRRVLPILWTSARGWSIAASVLMVFEIAFGLMTLYLVKGLVDAITSQLNAGGQVVSVETVLWQVVAFGSATLAFLVTRGVANLAREAQGMLVADHVDSMIHSKAVSADLAFYESPKYFDTLHRARQFGPQRPALVTSNLLLLGKNLIMLVAVIVLLASINWMLLPILLVAIIPALIVRIYFTRQLYDWQRDRTELERRAGYLNWLMTSDIHAKELRLNVDRIRTRMRAIAYIDPIDLRFNRFERRPEPTAQAVMFCLMDASASMTQELKDLAKRFFMLLHVFLTRHYREVDIVFIRHTSSAQEVEEDAFFNDRATGGTVVSSALEEMTRIVRERYPIEDWNIYAAQASDGHNFRDDMDRSLALLDTEILPICQYFAYIEVGDETFSSVPSDSLVWTGYETLLAKHKNFAQRQAFEPADIFPVFRDLFAADRQAA